MPYAEMATHLGRTVASIQMHVYSLRRQGRIPLPPPRRPAWTPDDDAHLIASATSLTIDELAAQLGRSVAAVQQRLNHLHQLGKPVPTAREQRSGGQLRIDDFTHMRRPGEVAKALSVPYARVRYHVKKRQLGQRIGVGSAANIYLSDADVAVVKAALAGERKPHDRNYVCVECGAPAHRRDARCADCSAKHLRQQERRYRQKHPLPESVIADQLEELAAYSAQVQDESRQRASSHFDGWSAEDDEFLIAHHQEPAVETALGLGRTYRAVLARRSRLRQRGLLPQTDEAD
jgi:DNA-directed RNA polymerase subunit RPC12/RpoP